MRDEKMDIYAVWAASIAFAAIVCLLTLTWLHDKEIKAARLAESKGGEVKWIMT